MTMTRWIRDLIRGYSDADLARVLEKFRERPAGLPPLLSRREYNAIRDQDCIMYTSGHRLIGNTYVFDEEDRRVWRRGRVGTTMT